MTEFPLIIAGGRDFTDFGTVEREIYRLAENELAGYGISIVSGMARGADALGVQFARKHSVKLYEFPADWDTFGKSAGYRRNEQMAQFAHGLLAFWDGQSRGTKHMIDIATRLNLSVRTIRY